MNKPSLSIETILCEAIEIDSPADRDAYLEEACGSDADLRRRVEILIADHFQAGDFLESPAAPVLARTATAAIHNIPGAQIGPYKIRELIGEGGMGEVFVAEQERPVRRKVALKIIRPGMATRDVIRRFEAERQALAMMEHPNIAKIFDAGTVGQAFQPAMPNDQFRSDGDRQAGKPAPQLGPPFFVMELVQGIPITEYCDECQLTTRNRLELFVTVCRAVQHAHQKGIIHRDIKPSNVLVAMQDGRPTPKIIDFGVAKSIGERLTDRTLTSGFAQMLGTPLYMSPEQAELSPLGVDTRSDVYSLGVLLYELLTGATPFDKDRLHTAPYDEVRRIIREEEPPRPSTRISTLSADAATTIADRRRTDTRRLVQTVRGELDWIVMKALDKDRNRRYETSAALADDIDRCLRDEPVSASPPNATYRVRKFIRRNRVAAAVCAAVLSGLLVGLSGVTAGLIAQKETTRQLRRESGLRLRQQYASDMNAAIMAYEENDLDRVEKLLRRYYPPLRDDHKDIRGPEWYFLWKAGHRARSTRQFAIAESYADAAALSPDGATLALCLARRPLTLLDLDSGAQMRFRDDKVGWGTYVAFSIDGQWLASPIGDATGIQIRDLKSGEDRLLHAGTRLFAIAFAPDGRLAAGSIGTIFLWNSSDPRTGQEIPVSSSPICSIAFAPDGQSLLAGDDEGQLSIVSVARAKLDHQIAAHEDKLTCLAYSPDGRLIATGSRDRSVAIWDSQSFERRATLRGHSDVVRNVAFSPSNPRLLASSARSGAVVLWDLETFSERATLRGISNGTVLSFTEDGRTLITEDYGRVALWNGVDRYVDAVKTDGEVRDVAISADSQIVISLNGDVSGRNGGPVTLRDAATANVFSLPMAAENEFYSIAVSSENTLAAGSTGRVHFRNLNGSTSRPPLSAQSSGRLTALDFSPSGDRIAIAASDGSVEVWKLRSNQSSCILSSPRAHSDVVCRLAFSPDGKLVASSSFDHTVGIWDLETASLLCTFRKHPYRVTALAFTPDGRHVASGGWGDGGAIYIWDPHTGQIEKQFDGDTDSIRDLLFLSNNTMVTACGDNRIKFIDVESGEQRMRLQGHTDAVECIAASPDGKLLVSGGRWDHSLRFWRAATDEDVIRARW